LAECCRGITSTPANFRANIGWASSAALNFDVFSIGRLWPALVSGIALGLRGL
jgi:hypothetical protein